MSARSGWDEMSEQCADEPGGSQPIVAFCLIVLALASNMKQEMFLAPCNFGRARRRTNILTWTNSDRFAITIPNYFTRNVLARIVPGSKKKLFRMIPKMFHVKHFCPVDGQNLTTPKTSACLASCRIAKFYGSIGIGRRRYLEELSRRRKNLAM
jgi:hypothetical protein